MFATGPWAGHEIAVLRRRTRVLDRVQVADTPIGPLTALRVMGTGGIDVHLVLGDDSEKAGEVLTTGIDVLAGRHHTVRADALPAGNPGPGITVRFVRDHEPGDRLNLTVPRFTVTFAQDLLDLPDVFGLATATDTSAGTSPASAPSRSPSPTPGRTPSPPSRPTASKPPQ
ncbi:hypothetical protein ACTMTI_27935 [Nonomuraea sp. H19]|uniref:hypothetical protein n=1 Tax=Nonomuraea sp. H19 TaxID=3452206 RepID=UPI003F894E47